MLSLAVSLVLVPQHPASADPASELEIYDPSPAHPFGRRNPEAAPELAQFEFMLGEFDCVDEILTNGVWRRTDAIWNAHYFLNGHGIQDVYWNETFATSNIRIFDPKRAKWFVNFFRAPTRNVGTGVWVGVEEGEGANRRMVMWLGSPDRKNGSRLTFFDITDDGFEWIAESVRDGRAVPTWKSSCRRRVPGRKTKVPGFLGNDPTPARPFGRRAMDAPEALDGLAFQVGQFVEGAQPVPVGWRSGRWFLNGWGIQSDAYRKGVSETLIQVYDQRARRLRVTRYRMPGCEWSVWDGPIDGTTERAKPEPGEGKVLGVTLRETLRNGVAPAAPRTVTLTPDGTGYIVEYRSASEAGGKGEATRVRQR